MSKRKAPAAKAVPPMPREPSTAAALAPSCASCPFWRPMRENLTTRGHCRRYPPTPMQHAGGAVFPTTAATEWCGEWGGGDRAAYNPFPVLDAIRQTGATPALDKRLRQLIGDRLWA